MAVSGSYYTTQLRSVHFELGSLQTTLPAALKDVLPADSQPRVLILTGKSLLTKTDVIRSVQQVLGEQCVATYAEIGEHAPVKGIEAAGHLLQTRHANVIVAVGGGSPIDSAKAVAYFHRTQGPSTPPRNVSATSFIPIIAIPTTLSVAETTSMSGYTSAEGHKISVSHDGLAPRSIIYDGSLCLDTPERLWLSSGMRAVDHAIEQLYRPDPIPFARGQCYHALRELFHLLPLSKEHPKDQQIRHRLLLACFSSLWPEKRTRPLGLSHGLGHKLGATYKIPHGMTSCLTLSQSIIHTAQSSSTTAQSLFALSDALAFIPQSCNPHPSPSGALIGATAPDEAALEAARANGVRVGEAVRRLVDTLGLNSGLKDWGLSQADLDDTAGRATGKEKGTREWQDIRNLLGKIYEGPRAVL